MALLRRGENILIVRNCGAVLWSLPGQVLSPPADAERSLKQYLFSNLWGLRFAKKQQLQYFCSYNATDEIGLSCAVQIFEAQLLKSKIKPRPNELAQISLNGLGFIANTLFEQGALNPLTYRLLTQLSRSNV